MKNQKAKGKRQKVKVRSSVFATSNFCLLIFAFCLLPFSISAQDSRPLIRVAAQSTAHDERLSLGDIAEVIASNDEIAVRLRQIALGYAPNVRLVRELSRQQIAMALAAAGFNENAVQLEAPALVTIKRASQTVDPAIVREAVEKATLTDLQSHGATARLLRFDLPPVIEIPAGKYEARATLGNVRDIYSPFTVFVDLWMEGRIVHRFGATVQVEAYAPVLIAKSAIAPNTRLRPDNVATEVRRLNRPLSAYLLDVGKLRGMSVRTSIARGDAITTDSLLADIVIKPGDQVRLIGESADAPDRVQIVVSGEARTAGRIGDRVQVKNLQSGNLIQAIIVDEGIVRVRF